jgi:chorismate mutase
MSQVKPVFSLSAIAAQLEALEETIIYKLIDRAQYCLNAVVYEKGKSGFDGAHNKSLFAMRLLYQEKMDAQFGRFCVPEERPFLKRLPKPRRVLKLPSTGLVLKTVDMVNLGGEILSAYFEHLPHFCRNGNDGHYGSSVEADVYALQAIARRIHYGALYVAECKYRDDTKTYNKLIEAKDKEGVLAVLTRKEVEDRITIRIREKVQSIQNNVNRDIRYTIKPDYILALYRDVIIPLTKEGEVQYLLNRVKNGKKLKKI